MLEEKKELNDKELEKVAAGGSGYAENGIHGETYTAVIIGRYYCGKQHPTDGDSVLYVVDTNIGKYCCRAIHETLRIDDDNNWHTESGFGDLYTWNEMQSYYNYVLNIRP